MSTTQVPTNGFQVPPAQAPAVPDQVQQGFQIPPAGPAAATPGFSIAPVQGPGQVPGWVNAVQAPPAGQPAPQTPQVQAPPAQNLDATGIAALIQAALGQAQAPAQQAPATAPVDRPAWLQSSVAEFDLSKVDDPIIRSMGAVLQTVGKDLDLDRVLGKALAHGSVQLIDYAYLHEKGGANAQQLAEIAKGIVQAVEAKSAQLTSEVHATVGGEANWNAATAAFNTQAPQELRVTVSQMLDSADPSLIKAGAKIVAQFGAQSGLIPQQGASLLHTASAGMQGQGLSKAQFQAELQKLDRYAPDYPEAEQALFARRSLGKGVGL